MLIRKAILVCGFALVLIVRFKLLYQAEIRLQLSVQTKIFDGILELLLID